MLGTRLTTSSKVRPRNLWDTLPPETKNRIFSFCDVLTRYLNNLLPDDKNLEETVCNSIWKAAFELDWVGDLDDLPEDGFPNVFNGLKLVHSREMYKKLCNYKPKLCYTQARNKLISLIKYKRSWNKTFDDELEIAKHCLIHIPLNCGWKEQLSEVPFMLQGIYAAYFGHVEVVKSMMPQLRKVFPEMFNDYIVPDDTDDDTCDEFMAFFNAGLREPDWSDLKDPGGMKESL
ncbi:hypothetical protein HDV05_008803 [Chytridiales sp. JEL 0842]|nr:hypothetical protein HDV05_008803 [Chytridiales sp. JEL 0842]